MNYQEEQMVYDWMDQHRKRCRFGRGTDELFSVVENIQTPDNNQIIKVVCLCTATKEFHIHYSGVSQ